MYLKNWTIQQKSTKYRKIQDNFLIFPKYRKYRKYRTCGSSVLGAFLTFVISIGLRGI